MKFRFQYYAGSFALLLLGTRSNAFVASTTTRLQARVGTTNAKSTFIPPLQRHATTTSLNMMIPNIPEQLDSIRSTLQDASLLLSDLLNQAQDFAFLNELEALGNQINQALEQFLQLNPELEPYAQYVQNYLYGLELNVEGSPQVLLLLSGITTYWVVSSVLSIGQEPPPSKPYPLLKYDATSARAYFDERIHKVLSRGLEVGANSLSFALNVGMDYVQNKLDAHADLRAVELAQLLTKLGPSFIKIGQSLSIRTDLLSPPYVRGLQTLQDQVPPFDSKTAFSMLEEEWGVPYDTVLRDISAEPVAAASLGQVYKATMHKDGREVAIKVQRPNIMNQIALDMHLLREVAPIVKRIFKLNTDTVGTVDTWGAGFVDELDYISEAEHAQVFMESIQTTPLSKVVFAPPIVEEWTTRKILVTEWVDGERLDQSSNEDVTVLCSIAMNTYLTMMLETGLLHCDPHPGNLLRTPDGRLCILDWGMVTRLDKNLQLTLIEHMAHLTSADYAEIPQDLLRLGFIPKHKADLIQDSGVVETLADIYGAWSKGGGAATINVNKVISQLQDLTATRGNLFQIPPYFAYIAKSFSVLEGIGLSNDKQYSIINECLPYVSKRLLTDNSSRTGGALSTFIFGPDKGNVDTRIIDYERVEQLVTGFGDYTTSASGALLGKTSTNDTDSALSRTALLESVSEQVMDLVLSEKETPFQSIIVEQVAKIISSASRSVWTELRERSGKLPSGRTVLGTLVDPLGLWRTSPIVRMNELDAKTMETTRNLIQLLQQQIMAEESASNHNKALFDLTTLSGEEVLELSLLLIQKLWDRRLGVFLTGNRLATQLLQLTANKLERGEREVWTLPTTTTTTPATTTSRTSNDPRSSTFDGTKNGDTTPRPSLVSTATAKKPASLRLQSARRLLSDIENDKTSWSMPSQEQEALM